MDLLLIDFNYISTLQVLCLAAPFVSYNMYSVLWIKKIAAMSIVCRQLNCLCVVLYDVCLCGFLLVHVHIFHSSTRHIIMTELNVQCVVSGIYLFWVNAGYIAFVLTREKKSSVWCLYRSHGVFFCVHTHIYLMFDMSMSTCRSGLIFTYLSSFKFHLSTFPPHKFISRSQLFFVFFFCILMFLSSRACSDRLLLLTLLVMAFIVMDLKNHVTNANDQTNQS